MFIGGNHWFFRGTGLDENGYSLSFLCVYVSVIPGDEATPYIYIVSYDWQWGITKTSDANWHLLVFKSETTNLAKSKV